jgi:hypothetical protein
MRRYHPIIPEVRKFHDFGAKTNSANNKIKDFVNQSKKITDALNKIRTFAKGTSGPSKKFAQAIGGDKFTDWEPSDEIKDEVEAYFTAREREKKMGPRANDPDQNVQMQLRGAADLRGQSVIKLDDGSSVKVSQNDAKILSAALDKIRTPMRKKMVQSLSKNKREFNSVTNALKRAWAKIGK